VTSTPAAGVPFGSLVVGVGPAVTVVLDSPGGRTPAGAAVDEENSPMEVVVEEAIDDALEDPSSPAVGPPSSSPEQAPPITRAARTAATRRTVIRV
jgi:hypothetical protein